MNFQQVHLKGIFFAILLVLIISVTISGCGGGGGTTGSAKDGTEVGKLGAPVITPAGGSFQKAQNVVISNTSFTTVMEVEPTTYQNVQYNGEAWYLISLIPGNFLRTQVTFS